MSRPLVSLTFRPVVRCHHFSLGPLVTMELVIEGTAVGVRIDSYEFVDDAGRSGLLLLEDVRMGCMWWGGGVPIHLPRYVFGTRDEALPRRDAPIPSFIAKDNLPIVVRVKNPRSDTVVCHLAAYGVEAERHEIPGL